MNAPPIHRRRFLQLFTGLLALPAALRAAIIPAPANRPLTDSEKWEQFFGNPPYQSGESRELVIEQISADGTVVKRGVQRTLEDGTVEEVSYWEHPTHPDLAEQRELRAKLAALAA